MKKTSIQIIILLFYFITTSAQTKKEFWGMTFGGGKYNGGTIFKTDGNGENQSVVKDFPYPDNSFPSYNKLCETPDGRLFGVITFGGINKAGELFEYNISTNTFNKKFDFSDADGSMPYNSLVLADNGKLYGTTTQGGKNNVGVLFEWDPITNMYTKKFEFNRNDGAVSYGSLMKASNGKLYGTTFYGGLYDYGIIYEWDPVSGIFTKKIDISPTKGYDIFTPLFQASNSKFYGMAAKGGAYDKGVLFEWDLSANTYTTLIDFDGNDKGDYPHGALVQAGDGNLYGMTAKGGINSAGVIFEWNLTTNMFTKKFDFTNLNSDTGYQPYGSLTLAKDGNLYGMTNLGGKYFKGVLFEWDIIQNKYIKKLDFDGIGKGSYPGGSLMLADNGKFYGTTKKGGVNDLGVLFEWNIEPNTYLKKVDFSGVRLGGWPSGSLIQGSSGRLYGMTYSGGVHANGEIFNWNFTYNNLNIMYDFYYEYYDASSGGYYFDGYYPNGMLLEASNGNFYGLTTYGGKFNKGVLFELDPVLKTYNIKFDFSSGSARPTGYAPYGSLIQSDEGKLYGMTSLGGLMDPLDTNNSYGVIFEFDLNTDTYAKKFNFNGLENGSRPYGNLVKADNGNFYGMTSSGGSNDLGVLFECNFINNTFKKLLDFNGVDNGSKPYGSLIQGNNMKLYGMTSKGGTNDKGVLFEFDPSSNHYLKILDFSGTTNGSIPLGTLLQASNGNIYGLTSIGGLNDKGTLFELNPITNQYSKKLDFNLTNGSNPLYTELIEITLPSSGIPNMQSKNEEDVNIFSKENQIIVQNKLNAFEHGSIIVYDILGNEISTHPLIPDSEIKIEVNTVAQAIYIVKIISDNHYFTKKICVTK